MSCQFVPPYLLQHVPTEASDSTLALDAQLRARRATAPTTPPPPPTVTAPSDLRVVHTAHNTQDLPGDAVRADGDPPSGDVAVDEAFDSSGQTLSMFADVFGRKSVDGQGTTLSVTVHYGQDYDNAFWDGQQLVFGDGDGEVFGRFTRPIDVMGHEFTHGVTQYTAGLTYQDESGALNESVSDVFGSMLKQRVAGQTVDQADWLIGEGIFLSGVNAKALRSMIAPGTAYDDPRLGKDPQVGSMDDYVHTTEDSGGVHINSGIPNRAFALAANAIGGYSWDKAGKIWYDALTGGQVTAATDFAGFAQATVSSASRLFPDDLSVAQKVRDAWGQVKVLSDAAPPQAAAGVSPDPAGRVAVRRSGGFAGGVRSGELDLDSDPNGAEVRRLLRQVDVRGIAATPTAPDRFVYTVEYGQMRLTVPEQDLTPELSQVVRLVLGDRSSGQG
jgi:hypothetical protein